MKNATHRSGTHALARPIRSTFAAALLPALGLMLSAQAGHAGSATWLANPTSGDWNTAANWMPNTVPNGSGDIATFDVSNTTGISISAETEINGIVFNPGSSAFTITATLVHLLAIGNGGITNNSGIPQNFVTVVDEAGNTGAIAFFGSATAGSLTTFTTEGGMTSNGVSVEFLETASAGEATFKNNGSALVGGFGGLTDFFNNSTAGNGTFTNDGGVVTGGGGGVTNFTDKSRAGNAVITSNGATVNGAAGGGTSFGNSTHAGNATLIANGGLNGGGGGSIQFQDGSSGDTARVELFGNGHLDITFLRPPDMTVASIEGNGAVFLGSHILVVGSNSLSTTFSGVIQDGGAGGGVGGSLSKIGTGTLRLTGANTYTGGTTLTKGALIVKNKTGSATGSGPVQVNLGTLQGVGKISGAVTVGTGTTSGAILLAGNNATSPGILTINNTLTFNSLSTYQCVLNRTKGKASTLTALGVTINSNVPFTFVDTGTGTLTVGTIFTVINNTSANPIFGTFSNLPNGSTFTSNGANFQVNYTGGTGNDLTLTVVP